MITYAVKWPGKNLIHAFVKCNAFTSILAKYLGKFLVFLMLYFGTMSFFSCKEARYFTNFFKTCQKNIIDHVLSNDYAGM